MAGSAPGKRMTRKRRVLEGPNMKLRLYGAIPIPFPGLGKQSKLELGTSFAWLTVELRPESGKLLPRV